MLVRGALSVCSARVGSARVHARALAGKDATSQCMHISFSRFAVFLHASNIHAHLGRKVYCPGQSLSRVCGMMMRHLGCQSEAVPVLASTGTVIDNCQLHTLSEASRT